MTIPTIAFQPIHTAPDDTWVLCYLPWLREEKWRAGMFKAKRDLLTNKVEKKWKIRFSDHRTSFIDRVPHGWMMLEVKPVRIPSTEYSQPE